MATFEQFIDEIDKSYTKANLEKFYSAFLKNFLASNRESVQKKGADLDFLQSKKSPIKAELINSFTTVLYEKELFLKLLDELPEPLPQVWKGLLLEGPVMQTTLEKRYNLKIAENKSRYSVDLEVNPLFTAFLFKGEYNYYASGNANKLKVLFFLPPVMRRHLLTHIEVPEEYQLKPISEPAAAQFLYEDNHGILEEFPLFLAYYQQGDIKYSSSGKPMASSINKMRKFCNSREFYPDDKDRKDLANLRTQLVAEALPLAGKVNQLTGSVPELLQRIVKNFAAGDLSVLYSLLFHLKGTAYVKNNYEDDSVNSELVAIMKNLPTGNWVEFGNLRRHVSLFYQPLMPVTPYTANNYLYLEVVESDSYGSYKDRLSIGYELYQESISIPLLKSTLFFFAAIGLADIAFDLPKNELAESLGRDYMSVWDGLRYVRLTPLGAFVLGQTSFYEPPKIEKSGELYLEEDRLLINYTGDDKVTAMMLDKVASKSTATRYKVDYQTFLKDCSTEKDIQNKIETFRTHIEAKPPQVWEDFFQELLNKYNPLQKESKLRVFSIPPENKELIALLARDEVLKKLVIKAEQYHILVKEKDMPALRARLEKFGFLLERGK